MMGLGSQRKNMCEGLRQEGDKGHPKIRGPWGRKGMCVMGGRRSENQAVKAVGGC